MESKGERQCASLRQRNSSNARAVMRGNLDEVQAAYKPRDIAPQEERHATWDSHVQTQDKLIALVARAKHAKNEKNRVGVYDVIMTVRQLFPDLAKKIGEPQRPVNKVKPKLVSAITTEKEQEKDKDRQQYSMPPPSYHTATAGVSAPYPSSSTNKFGPTPHGLPTSNGSSTSVPTPGSYQRLSPKSLQWRLDASAKDLEKLSDRKKKPSQMARATAIKQEDIVDLDSDVFDADDDFRDDSYDPKADRLAAAPNTAATRGERAVKRTRNRTGDASSGPKINAATDPEDVEFQIAEVQFSANLKVLSLKRKQAAMLGKNDIDLQLEEIQVRGQLQTNQNMRHIAALKKKKRAVDGKGVGDETSMQAAAGAGAIGGTA